MVALKAQTYLCRPLLGVTPKAHDMSTRVEDNLEVSPTDPLNSLQYFIGVKMEHLSGGQRRTWM